VSEYKAIDNITIERGETFEYVFQIEVGGAPLDLTNYLIYAQIREFESRSSDLIGTFAVTVDDVAPPNAFPTDSEVKLYLSQDDTVAAGFLNYSEGWYDVLFVAPGGERTYYLGGRVYIEGTVSQEI